MRTQIFLLNFLVLNAIQTDFRYNFFEYCMEKKVWLVIPDKPSYKYSDVIEKANKYKWDRTKILTFFILQKMHDIKIKKGFCQVYENDIIDQVPDFNLFEIRFNAAIKNLKSITANAYNNNIFSIDRTNPAFDVINHIAMKIKTYTEDGGSFFERQKSTQPGLNSAEEMSNQIFERIAWNEVEYRLLTGDTTIKTMILKEVFNLDFLYNDLSARKNLQFIVWSSLMKYMSSKSIYNIIFLDWSKYILELSLKYTYKYYRPAKLQQFYYCWNDCTALEIRHIFDKCMLDAQNPMFTILKRNEEFFESSIILDDYSSQNVNTLTNENALIASFVELCAVSLGKNLTRKRFAELIIKYNLVCNDTIVLPKYTIKDGKKIISFISYIVDDTLNDEYKKIGKNILMKRIKERNNKKDIFV